MYLSSLINKNYQNRATGQKLTRIEKSFRRKGGEIERGSVNSLSQNERSTVARADMPLDDRVDTVPLTDTTAPLIPHAMKLRLAGSAPI